MNESDALKAKREIVVLAKAILDGRVEIVEAVRKICRLRYLTDDPDHSAFIVMRSVDSETDQFPIGAIRDRFAIAYLQQLDDELQHYLADVRGDILSSCREIIQIFASDY